MKTMKNTNTIARGAILVFLAIIFGKLFSYLYVVLVSRLGSAVYGILSIAFAIILFLETVSIIGLDRGILRYVSYFRGKNDKPRIKGTILDSLVISFVLSIGLFILLFFFADVVSIRIFKNSELGLILKIFSFFLPFAVISHILAISLRAFEKAKYEIIIKEFIEKSLKFIVTLILLVLGFGVVGASFGYVTPLVLSVVIGFIVMQKKVFPIFGKKVKSTFLKKEILFYSIPLMFVSLLSKVISWTDVLMLGYFKTASDVGIYNVALPTAHLLFVAPISLTYLFMPVIGKLYGRGKTDEIKHVYSRTSKWTFMMSFWLFLFMVFFAEKIIVSFFSETYSLASLPFMILLFGYIVFSLSYICSEMLSVIKKTKTLFFIILAFSIVNILLNYGLIPTYGLIGAAIATSAAFVFGAFLIILLNYKFTGLHPFKMIFFKLGLCALISIGIVYWIGSYFGNGLVNLVILGLVYSIIYLGLLFLFKCLDKEDLSFLHKIKGKIKVH